MWERHQGSQSAVVPFDSPLQPFRPSLISSSQTPRAAGRMSPALEAVATEVRGDVIGTWNDSEPLFSSERPCFLQVRDWGLKTWPLRIPSLFPRLPKPNS